MGISKEKGRTQCKKGEMKMERPVPPMTGKDARKTKATEKKARRELMGDARYAVREKKKIEGILLVVLYLKVAANIRITQ